MNDLPSLDPAPALTDAQKKALAYEWAIRASDLMKRYSTGSSWRWYSRGTPRIRDNPLLVAAIEEIRDRYFNLFNEARHYKSMPEAVQDSPEGRAFSGKNCDDTVAHNAASLERLQQPGYGLSAGRQAEILARNPGYRVQEDTALTSEEAERILGSVIKRCIASFNRAFNQEPSASMSVERKLMIEPRADSARSGGSAER